MIRMLFTTSLFILVVGPPIGEMDSIHTPHVNWHRSCLITSRLVMIPSEVPSASNFLQYFGCVLSNLITVSRLPVFYTDPLRKDMEMILRYLPHQSQPAMQPSSFNSPALSTLNQGHSVLVWGSFWPFSQALLGRALAWGHGLW